MVVLQIITRLNRGGTARWIDVLMTGLSENGLQTFLAAGSVQGLELEDPTFKKHEGIRLKGLGRSISIVVDVCALFEIRRLIRRLKPDLINTHTSKAGALGRLATVGLRKNRPTVVHTFHGHLLYGYFRPLKKNLIVFIEILLSRFTDLYISSGTVVRDELVSSGVATRAKYVVVKPGIDDFESLPKSQLRKSLSIQEDVIVVGWLGRVVDIKRPDIAIEVARHCQEVIFLLAGDGELLEKSKINAPSNIIFTGWSTPSEIWGASDIALLTSENEAQPISLVEAGYAGLPCVAMAVGSISEVIEHGITGYLGTSTADLVKYINDLSRNSEKRIRFGKSAREKMLAEFSVSSFIANHISAYKRAIEIHKK